MNTSCLNFAKSPPTAFFPASDTARYSSHSSRFGLRAFVEDPDLLGPDAERVAVPCEQVGDADEPGHELGEWLLVDLGRQVLTTDQVESLFQHELAGGKHSRG